MPTTPQLKQKDPKVPQNNKKPSAQDLHQQQKADSAPSVNPTNAADKTSSGETTPNRGAGYSTPDAPSEGDNSVDTLQFQNDGGGKEQDDPNPVKDNPKMSDGI